MKTHDEHGYMLPGSYPADALLNPDDNNDDELEPIPAEPVQKKTVRLTRARAIDFAGLSPYQRVAITVLAARLGVRLIEK